MSDGVVGGEAAFAFEIAFALIKSDVSISEMETAWDRR